MSDQGRDAALATVSTSSRRREHHKYVWCSRCHDVMVMRIGARGCYRGHAYAIKEISREEFEQRRQNGRGPSGGATSVEHWPQEAFEQLRVLSRHQ